METDLRESDSLLSQFLLGGLTADDDASVKACCAYLYDHPVVRWTLGSSYHPGGEALTRHLGGLLGLAPSSLVLDVATGRGRTPQLLAEASGCRVIGLDFGAPLLPLPQENGRPEEASLAFCKGDSEALPFADAIFQAIVCECSFCLFPNKERAASEFRRTLRPGGRVGISDVTVALGATAEDFRDVLAWVSCIADARPPEEYASLMEAAGLSVVRTEDQTGALAKTLSDMRKKLFVLQVGAKAGELKLRKNGDTQALEGLHMAGQLVAEGLRLVKQDQGMVEQGSMGYCLLVAEKPGRA